MKTEIKHIAFLVIPEATLLDITGPFEVFAQTMDCLRPGQKNTPVSYVLETLSSTRNKSVKTASGLTITCDSSIYTYSNEIDTLFIPGVPNSIQENYKLNIKVLEWITRQSLKVRRICSVCTGTFFLAKAGILQGKKATSHWDMCEILARKYPQITVESDPIFVKDGNVYTSAGISAGMDLALALVEEDFGRSLALEVAKQMVLYLKRPGNQSQFSSVLTYQKTDYRPIQQLESWVQDHLKDNLTVEVLAEQASMSPRNFARIFVREKGITPAKYIEKLRIEMACRFLVESQLTLDEIAGQCGLQNSDNMRRVFLKNLNTTPSSYKKNFGLVLT